MGKLEGKAALITGASRGIGKAVALAYAKEGGPSKVALLNLLSGRHAKLVRLGSC